VALTFVIAGACSSPAPAPLRGNLEAGSATTGPYAALLQSGASWTLPCFELRYPDLENFAKPAPALGDVRCEAREQPPQGPAKVVQLMCADSRDAGTYVVTGRGLFRVSDVSPTPDVERAHPWLAARPVPERWDDVLPPNTGTSSYETYATQGGWCTEHHEWYGGSGKTSGSCMSERGLVGFYATSGEIPRGYACGVLPRQ
jgi:hypothetical protein